MLAGIGFDFGAVQAHCAQLKQPQRFGKHQYLDKQAFNFFAKALAKAVDGVVIRVFVGADVFEGHRIMSGFLQLATGKHAGRVAVE